MRSMFILGTVCIRAPGTCGSRNLLCGVTPNRALSVTAAGTVVDGKLEERSAGNRKRGMGGQVRSFEEIPHTGSNGWVNLVKFWREDRFRQLHKHMERTFSAIGPIYR